MKEMVHKKSQQQQLLLYIDLAKNKFARSKKILLSKILFHCWFWELQSFFQTDVLLGRSSSKPVEVRWDDFSRSWHSLPLLNCVTRPFRQLKECLIETPQFFLKGQFLFPFLNNSNFPTHFKVSDFLLFFELL